MKLSPKRTASWHIWTPPALAVVLLLTAMATKLPLAGALAVATVYTCIIGIVRGYEFGSLWQFMWRGMLETMPVLLILALVGALIGVWAGTGTISSMISLGLQIARPEWLLVTCFIIAGAMSMLIGSSVGTLSTIGLAMMGIASNLGLPAGWVGGALLSGAFLGDRSAFVSSTYHLAMSTTKSEPERSWPLVLRRAMPGVAVCVIVYAFVGWRLAAAGDSGAHLSTPTGHINWWLLLAPGVVLLLAVAKVPARWALVAGLLVALALGIAFGSSPLTMFSWMWSGADLSDPTGATMHSGGVLNMIAIFLIILTAAAFNGAYEGAGMLTIVVRPIVAGARGAADLLRRASLASIAVASVACNQTLSVIMPGRVFRDTLPRWRLAPQSLAVALLDSGGLAAGLIPWNQFAIVCSSMIGMLPQQTAPYALLPWVLMVVAFVWPTFGLRASDGAAAMSGEETAV